MLGFALIRLGLKMSIFVIGARWMYAETALVAPSLLPIIDAALAKVSIPTHDTWGEHYESVREFASNFKTEHKDLFDKVAQQQVKSPVSNGQETPQVGT